MVTNLSSRSNFSSSIVLMCSLRPFSWVVDGTTVVLRWKGSISILWQMFSSFFLSLRTSTILSFFMASSFSASCLRAFSSFIKDS